MKGVPKNCDNCSLHLFVIMNVLSGCYLSVTMMQPFHISEQHTSRFDVQLADRGGTICCESFKNKYRPKIDMKSN